jgi:copper chaperone
MSLTLFCNAGVESFDVSLENQTAEIKAVEALPYETVLATIKKTGKKVKSGEADGKEMPIE